MKWTRPTAVGVFAVRDFVHYRLIAWRISFLNLPCNNLIGTRKVGACKWELNTDTIFLLSMLSGVGVQLKLNVNYVWRMNFEFTEIRFISKTVQLPIKLAWYWRSINNGCICQLFAKQLPSWNPGILFLFILCKPSSLLKDTERLNNIQIVDTQTDWLFLIMPFRMPTSSGVSSL